MIVDCHVHVSACTPSHGWMSPRMQRGIAFRFLRWKLGIDGSDPASERVIEQLLADTLDGTPELDAAVVLAFDAVHDCGGRRNNDRTHLYVTNDYVIELCQRHPKMRFGCSVHPYRADAVAEIERCVAAGAVLLKWLPLVQDFDPTDARCMPVYEALAHYKLPLLSHTGGEKSLPIHNRDVAEPRLLEPALKRGVTVIAAHCGTRSAPTQPCHLQQFIELTHKYENLFGDTAALNLPARSYAYSHLMADPIASERLVHGSDWPIPSFPPATRLGPFAAIKLLGEKNGMRRDLLAKQRMRLGDGYATRAAKVLGLNSASVALASL